MLCFYAKLVFTVWAMAGGVNPSDLVLRPVGIARYFNMKNTHCLFNPFRNLPRGTARFSARQVAPSHHPGTKVGFYLLLGIWH